MFKGEVPTSWQEGQKSCLESNLRLSRDSWRVQTKPFAHQDPEKGAVTPQSTEPDLL